MKRFSPYTTYTQSGQLFYKSTAPDGSPITSHTWHDDRIADILSLFEIPSLKALQPQIIRSILSGSDTLAVMPTGSGKTLCFQAPAIFFPGLTLVITPLVALIENQVHNFNSFFLPYRRQSRSPQSSILYPGIQFKAIYPGLDSLSLQAMFAEILRPHTSQQYQTQYKLLYVSPERLTNPKFLRALSEAEANGLQISHIVIDEVHCMSQWGFEFRESYLEIAGFIKQRPLRPIISAFTATATPRDIQAIKSCLNFPQTVTAAKAKYQEFISIQKRPNLALHLLPCANDTTANPTKSPAQTRYARLINLLEAAPAKVCIIYRTTTSGVDELYSQLQAHPLLKDRVVKYHAQMPKRAKARSKNAFLRSYDENLEPTAKYFSRPCQNIMIATKAFGMGIDKQNISQIIHYDIPRSLEDYYQEVGRAGRDAARVPQAQCWLLYANGPKSAKGTLQYTINWVTSEKNAAEGCMPLYSQFSNELKTNIYFWSYYRLCYMLQYCLISQNISSNAAHDFIIAYLQNRFSPEQSAAAIQTFYDYVLDSYPLPKAQRKQFIESCLFSADQAAGFLQPSAQAAHHAEIKRLTNQVNELHINNTYAANLLRHKPHKYQLNTPYILSQDSPSAGQEWKSRKNKRVKGQASQTLRRSDIQENSAFIFENPDDPAACQQYVNAAWQAEKKQRPQLQPSVIFTVNYDLVINGVLKMQDTKWQLLTAASALQPYKRCLGCNVKGLFSQEQYGWWRQTRARLFQPASPTDSAKLFAYAPGARSHQLSLTIHGSEKLSYFDMCVLDAIYSIELAQKETIYVQTIWELLTGRNPHYSSQEKLAFRTAIQNSINKMRDMSISITDNQCSFAVNAAPFLPLLDKPPGQKGYAYKELPPLCRYAEKMNGQIIKVPISLLNTAKISPATLWKDDFNCQFKPDPADGQAVPVKCLPYNAADADNILNNIPLPPKALRQLASLQKSPYRFSPSIANALLCHYLAHRIAISKNRKRGSFIRFSTIKTVTNTQEDTSLLHKKILALLNYYQHAGYLHQYYAYIANHPYQLADGTVLTDTAYFRVKATGSLKYWQQRDSARLAISDFTLSWSPKYNDELADDNSNFELKSALVDALNREGQRLSSAALQELAAMPIGRLEGVVLKHE